MKTIDPYVFWRNVDEQLDAKGITLTSLCNNTGIAYKAVSMQRTRHALPKSEQLYAMSVFLDVSMEYLLTGEKSVVFSSKEAQAVEHDEELRYLVRLCMNDRSLVSFITHVRNAQDIEKAN